MSLLEHLQTYEQKLYESQSGKILLESLQKKAAEIVEIEGKLAEIFKQQELPPEYESILAPRTIQRAIESARVDYNRSGNVNKR